MKTLEKISAAAGKYMAIIVLVVAALALFVPTSLSWIKTSWVNTLLGIVMFGMGLTIRASDFKVVFSHPKDILIGCLAQFTVMPVLAWILTMVFQLDTALAVGVILVGTMLTAAHKQALHTGTVPVVLAGQHTEGVSCVYHDDRGAARAMTGLLLAGGRRAPGYIGVTPRDKAAGAARRAGYQDALHENGLEPEPTRMEQSDFSIEGGYAAAGRLLARAAVDALFCATDSIAVGAMQRLRELGLRIPEDVAVAGIGHSRLSELVRPRLSTAHYYYQTSGEEAARALLEILERGIDRKKQLMLGFEVCKFESA